MTSAIILLAATLCAGGKGDYTVVVGTNGVYDRASAIDFTNIFERVTGVSLPVVSSGTKVEGKRIFIGVSSEAESVFGKEKLAYLVAKCTERDGDLYIRGGGNEGTGLAAHHFLEEYLGYRSYTMYEGDERIVRTDTVKTDGRELVRDVAFKGRRILGHSFIYYHPECEFHQWRNGATPNGRWYKGMMKGYSEDLPPKCTNHGFNLWITTKNYMNFFKWDEPRDYWKEHPEWFTLGRDGKRCDAQQCFSNKELRKEFTKRVLEQCRRANGPGAINIGANDWPGSFCFCKDCLALEKEYGTPSGAFYDYLLELLPIVKAQYPDIRIVTLAYRKEQTEKCPKIKGRFPDNFICDFAPVEDDQSKTIGGPDNEKTLENLKAWHKVCDRIESWLYVCTTTAPFGPVTRIARELKAQHANGVIGCSLCGLGSPSVFALQEYLAMRLWMDLDTDVWAETEKYCQTLYGAAAPEALEYIRNCDRAWFKEQPRVGIDAKGANLQIFNEYLVKWQELARRAEAKLKPGSREARNFSWIRWDIDFLTLVHWDAVLKQNPPKDLTPDGIFDRMKTIVLPAKLYGEFRNKQTKKPTGLYVYLETAHLCAKAAGKPLPAEFAKLPKEQVIVLPCCDGAFPVDDPDAIAGRAATQPIKDTTKAGKTFIGYNYYENAEKHELFAYKSDGRTPIEKRIDFSKATHGKYELYFLGKVRVTQSCSLNVGNWWGIRTNLSSYYPEGDPDRLFELWGSFKFCGQSFKVSSPVEGNPDRIMCDAFYLIDKNGDKYKQGK